MLVLKDHKKISKHLKSDVHKYKQLTIPDYMFASWDSF